MPKCNLCTKIHENPENCSANEPLPGFIHEDCGGTVVPYNSNIWKCLKCKEVAKRVPKRVR